MVPKTYDNILIGGSGFIGSALADALSQKKETVLSISRNVSGVLPEGVEELVVDINDPQFSQLPSAKTVFILIGQNSSDFNVEQELQGLESIIQKINNIHPEKVIYLSSVLAYGECKTPATEDVTLVPVDPYSTYKVQAEELLRKQINTEVHLGILRLANVYGSPKNRGFIGFLMKQVGGSSREKITVNGDGSQERDYIFLDDVVAALIAVKSGLRKNDTINIASGKSFTLLEVIQTVEEMSKTSLEYETGGKGGKEVHCSRVDNKKLVEEYGFTPKHSLRTGLAQTLIRYQGQKRVLLLGGEGFIGRNIIDLLSSTHTCFSVGEKASFFPNRKATLVKGDPYEVLVSGKFDAIIHLIDHKVPLEQFLEAEKMLVSCLPLTADTHLILFSSAVVYVNPPSDYGKRKRSLETFYRAYCEERGIPLTIFRPFNIFGPYQMPDRQGSLIANLLYNTLRDQATEIHDLNAQRDFIYVGDIARSVERVLKERKVGTYDVGSGRLTSIRALIQAVEKALSQPVPYIDKGLCEGFSVQPAQDRGVGENMVDLNEGLAATVAFYRDYSGLIETHRHRA